MLSQASMLLKPDLIELLLIARVAAGKHIQCI